MSKEIKKEDPNFLFEVSWEVANKVGGIHTVLVSKHQEVEKYFGKNQIYIGPDLKNDIQNSLEFKEDKRLFHEWQQQAPKEGLKVRVGRWAQANDAVTILVDFSIFLDQRDTLFRHYWNAFQLDSLKGQWDYIEPAIFGHAVGKVIESFARFHLSSNYKIVAHFHEWMTGTGLLYLKEHTPHIGTTFTTHATALGRAMASNLNPLYKLLNSVDPQEEANKLQISSKYSLEKITSQQADTFTTVSDITKKEAEAFLSPITLVTPNGFDTDLVPHNYEEKRKNAKSLLLNILKGLTGEERNIENTFFVGISGRYEFSNKGIDLFLKALGNINKERKSWDKKIVAFVLVPAGHTCAQQELRHNLEFPNSYKQPQSKYLTHHLSYLDTDDPVLKTLYQVGIQNSVEEAVTCIFAPVYLNGQDDVFNKTYYDILCGLDLTCFPSYYEPWGYTPLESVAFKVPTITTTLAGYGLWVKDNIDNENEGVQVISRNDNNIQKVIDDLAQAIFKYAEKNKKEYDKAVKDTKSCLEIAQWKELYTYYVKAYQIAVEKALQRTIQNDYKQNNKDVFVDYISKQNQAVDPIAHPIVVQLQIPEKLKFLETLSKNFWWSWNTKAKSLFYNINKELWGKVYYNPADFLNKLSLKTFQELAHNKEFLKQLAEIKEDFDNYMTAKPKKKTPRIAYFSMEYGLHSSFKIYSGGLGVLAGDYLKECSDQRVSMMALGLHYRYGYFTQGMSPHGEQRAILEDQFSKKTIAIVLLDNHGKEVRIEIPFPGRKLYIKVWKADVGRVPLYLLDTDIAENMEEDRSITHQLYGGNWENRLKQEMVLGIGGAKLVKMLDFKPDCYHLNEGHAALSVLERLRKYVEEKNVSFAEAIEIVRSTSVFTTHTPVPAGHDAFAEYLSKNYLHYLTDRLNISWDKLFNLGKDPNDNKFSMSFLAANLSTMINGVSKLHGEVSKEIFKTIWKGYYVSELDIKYVTNGVHYPTWCAITMQEVLEKYVDKGFDLGNQKTDLVQNIKNIPNEAIWDAKQQLKNRMFVSIRRRMPIDLSAYYTPKEIEIINEHLDVNVLTFGFARRFATYKRATLLFRDLNRLQKLVNDPHRPVRFIFAGKAHPQDIPGQELIKQIVQYSKQPEFLGKIIFLSNYDMQLSRRLVQGVDVWLNLPTRPLEASGTSGQKAVLNGTLHFSVLDGWWAEGYREKAGWALPLEATYENDESQNDLDAVMLYNIIEEEVAPAYYNKDNKNIAKEWLTLMKNSFCNVAFDYTTTRMLDDYRDKIYQPLYERAIEIKKNDFALAKKLAAWKKHVTSLWDDLHIEINQEENFPGALTLGQEKIYRVKVNIGQLNQEDIRVEMLVLENDNNKKTIIHYQDFKKIGQELNTIFYETKYLPQMSGNFSIGIRVYPHNDLLSNRHGLALVKWV